MADEQDWTRVKLLMLIAREGDNVFDSEHCVASPDTSSLTA